MFRRSRTERVKDSALNVSELALQLAQDKKFRKRMQSALEHGAKAKRRAARPSRDFTDTARRLAADQALRADLRGARSDLEQAYARFNAKKRTHRGRRITVVAGLAALAAAPQVRERVSQLTTSASKNRRLQGLANRAKDLGRSNAGPRTLDDLTKEELYGRAQEADIPGRSEMSKEQLIAALRARA